MARTGLAALTGGIKEGYEAVDEAKKRKQIRDILGHENVRLQNRYKGMAAVQKEGDEFDFTQFEAPETWGQKALGWVRGLVTPAQAPVQPQAIPAQAAPAAPGYAATPSPAAAPEQAIQPFVDGGAVRHMRKKYKDGGKAGKEEYTLWDDIKRNTFPETRRRFSEWDEGPRREKSKAIFDAEGAEAKGAAVRGRVIESGRGLATIASGVLEDTGALPLGRGVEALGRGAKGFLGFGGDGGETEAVKAIETDPTPEQTAETALPPETSAPQQAPTAAAAPGAGAPSGGEQDIDFSTQARQVMPEDIPSYTSKDWEKQRRYWAAYALSQGEDPFKAMEKVDAEQLSGFSRYAMQATALIDGGDMEGASRALYAAYQYFPNGKDVRFGIQQGKDGQRQIIAMGSDEGEGGKSSGPPQILNRNTISRMVENMKKPGALKAWTKDWQATEAKLWEQGFKRDELKEKGRHNRAMEGAYTARTAATRAGGGMKQADWDRAFGEFMDSRELQALDDPGTAEDLADVMTRLYQKAGPQTGFPSIIKAVMAASRDGSLDELREEYGLQKQAVQ